MKRSERFFCLLFPFITAAFMSCGIEEYYYLSPVPTGNIKLTLNYQANIQLPNIDYTTEFTYFTHYTIFYRIYISGNPVEGQIQASQTSMNAINPILYSDYSSILPYTSSDTASNTSIGTLFKNRNYYALNVEGEDLEGHVLNRPPGNTTLVINFQPVPGVRPTLHLQNSSGTPISAVFPLLRSNGNGSFNPVPNRYFLNSPQLHSSANVSPTINADVANNNVSGQRYTYAAFYIVVTGMDYNSFTPIYSNPTFVGILRLQDP
jgi:hypothetical protein